MQIEWRSLMMSLSFSLTADFVERVSFTRSLEGHGCNKVKGEMSCLPLSFSFLALLHPKYEWKAVQVVKESQGNFLWRKEWEEEKNVSSLITQFDPSSFSLLLFLSLLWLESVWVSDWTHLVKFTWSRKINRLLRLPFLLHPPLQINSHDLLSLSLSKLYLALAKTDVCSYKCITCLPYVPSNKNAMTNMAFILITCVTDSSWLTDTKSTISLFLSFSGYTFGLGVN